MRLLHPNLTINCYKDDEDVRSAQRAENKDLLFAVEFDNADDALPSATGNATYNIRFPTSVFVLPSFKPIYTGTMPNNQTTSMFAVHYSSVQVRNPISRR